MDDIDQLPRLVPAKQAAAYLGVSYRMIRLLIQEEKIAHITYRRRHFIPREELAKLLRPAA